MKKRRKPGRKAAPAGSGYTLGIVLSGGGSFGAWEIGALQALWDVWKIKFHEDPPIRIVAGTSTGAVIAPFALLERKHLAQVDDWYQAVTNSEIFGYRWELIAYSAAVFFLTSPSVLDYGYPTPECGIPRFYQNYPKALRRHKTLESCAAAWPDRRLGIATVDFGSGRLDLVTNSKSDFDPSSRKPYESRLYNGIVASAMSPLAGPAVLLQQSYAPKNVTPHLDGGVGTVAPFSVLFDLAAIDPPINLTHVIVISCYPLFPGKDLATNPFPTSPKFLNVGLRFDTLLSEAGATREIQIARAAIALREKGMTQDDVAKMTGLSIADPPVLIEALPSGRLGWDDGEFNHSDSKKMRNRGHHEATVTFNHAF